MLAVLVPSRGRPGNLRRLVDAIAATAQGDIRIYTYIDDDDPALGPYLDVLDATGIDYRIGPRVFYAAAVNDCAARAVKDGADFLAMFGDDVLPGTPGWDQMLTEALNGRLGVAYGSDGLEHKHGPDLPTHFVVPAEMYGRLGWIALPTIRHLFLDNVARELGKGLGNFVYLPDVTLTHLHRWARLAPDDQTYREANDKQRRELDRQAFVAWRDGDGYRAAMDALT